MHRSRLPASGMLPLLAAWICLPTQTNANPTPNHHLTPTYTTLHTLAPAKDFDRHDPSNIVRHDGRYWTFYTHNRNNHQEVSIHFASSPDGYNWTDHGPALSKGTPGAWDESGTIAPYCVPHQGRFHLFYTGFRQDNLSTRQLGCATAPHPSGPWSRLPQNPILQTSPNPNDWDSGMLGDSNPVFFQNQWWLFYKSRRHNETSRDTSIGAAISTHLTGPYSKHPANPLFQGHAFSIWQEQDNLNALCGILSPNVLQSPDGIHFHPITTLTNHSTGLFTPNPQTPPTWGLDVYTQNGTRGLHRFDLHQPNPSLQILLTKSPLIGFTKLHANLPGGRHANTRTSRAMVTTTHGDTPVELAPQLVHDTNSWTQFSGWSPNGQLAVISQGWENPDNAKWEEEHKTFRMTPGQWLLDANTYHLASGQIQNLTATHRVSHYNSGLFYLPNRQGLGFTALQDNTSKPFLMDPDGKNKRPITGPDAGFAYGYSASPDGSHLSYHEDYQVYIANADGSDRHHIKTGHPFNFAPQWSPDGQWLLFVSGTRGNSHPHVVRNNGSELRKVADLNGYQGWILFLDVPDYHEGSSDVPAWSQDSQSIFYTARTNTNVELFQTSLTGKTTRLTHTPEGSLHYHPTPSPDGQWLAYGSKRNGVRQLYIRHLPTGTETQITHLKYGSAAMWPHWQPTPP